MTVWPPASSQVSSRHRRPSPLDTAIGLSSMWLWLQPVPPPFGSCCSARGRPADQNTEQNGGAAVSARFGLGDRMVDSQSPEERKIENRPRSARGFFNGLKTSRYATRDGRKGRWKVGACLKLCSLTTTKNVWNDGIIHCTWALVYK